MEIQYTVRTVSDKQYWFSKSSFSQPLAISHKPQQSRSGLVQAVGRARERGIDFNAEYQRLSNEALDAMGAQPTATDSAADPLSQVDPRPQAPSAIPSAPAPTPAPAPDSGVETTRLFLEFLEKRERQLFDLMHTVVTKNQPATPTYPPSQQLQVETQIDRLGTAVADLTKVINANQPRFPRRVS
jgi:hypothetical protein